MQLRRHRTLVPLVFVLPLALVATGCGGDTSPASAADQPAGVAGSFEPGDFAALPKPEAATPFDDPTVDSHTTVQSFRVTGMAPEQILSFYEEQMRAAGWTPSSVPSHRGQDEWRGNWARDDQTLQVTAEPDTDDRNHTVVSQLDLMLTTG